MKYEVIIFDADETLFDFKKAEREAFKQTILDLEIKYDEDYHLKIYHEINTAIWKEFEKGQITQEKLKVDRFKRLSDKLNIEFNAEECAKRYMMHLAEGSFVFADSFELLEELKDKYKYKLIIITNGLTAVQDKRIRQSSIAKYFYEIVISEEISLSKPNAEIFNYALEKINYKDKSKVLMIGDSLSSDIQGGINAEIDTCWYNPLKINNCTSIKPTYEVSKLNEINLILK